MGIFSAFIEGAVAGAVTELLAPPRQQDLASIIRQELAAARR